MEISLIGIITLGIAFACLLISDGALISFLIFATLFVASAAITLPALGSANIQPAHLLIALAFLAMLSRPKNWVRAMDGLSLQRPGFYLALAVFYSLLTALFFPRLLAGMTDVFAISRATSVPRIVLTPLAPVSGNITQSMYLLGDLACFILIYTHAWNRRAILSITIAILTMSACNLLFAVIDVGTYALGMADVLEPVRNAEYTLLNSTSVGGIKRIVGSFTEASGFAYATLGLFAFTFRLWLCGLWSRMTGLLAGLSFVSLLLSTSTTAYVGLSLYLACLYVDVATDRVGAETRYRVRYFLVVAPVVFVCLIFALLMVAVGNETAQQLLDDILFNKASSQSGLERASWNTQAIINFIDTFGLGVGLGSTRASTFALAVLSNVGFIGGALYTVFLYRIVRSAGQAGRSVEGSIQAASSTACLALLIAALTSGGLMDLGLQFFLFAGLSSACSSLMKAPVKAYVPYQPQVVRA